MIKPLDAQLLPPVSSKSNETRSSKAVSSASNPVSRSKLSQRAPEGLAASIMSDGGLDFLRSRLESKLSDLFDEATANNPEMAAAGPAAFFDTSIDVTPEATADRIVGFALGMKGIFSRQSPQLGHEELLARFETEIRRGITDGFGHARGVLGGLELLNGEISSNVDLTWDLVQNKLDEFFTLSPSTEPYSTDTF